MRYLCVHCDEKFELPTEEEPRCPKCLRVHGLRALSDLGAGRPRSRRLRLGLLAGLVTMVALVGGAYAMFRQQRAPQPGELARGPLTAAVLGRELERQGIHAGDLPQLFSADAAVERFARAAVTGQSDPAGKAVAITAALRTRAKSNGFVPWSLTEPREGAIGMPNQVLAAIEHDGARKQLYPLEVAALGVAALRAVDVPAMLVELYAWPQERVPLDPSGRLGYFAVALGDNASAARIFDVYGGRPELAGCTDCALLSDLEAVGAVLSLRAAHRVAQNDDPAQALRDGEAAAKLLPNSPSVRCSHGAVLLASGARDPGQNEFEAAAQLRPDAPRYNNLAMLHLALGDSERATQDVARALERQPDYATGHVTLAQIHLARGERDQALAELQKADSLDPKLPTLALAFAQFYAAAGEHDQAIEYAKRAAEQRPRDPQVHLMLAQILHQAARYDEMRGEARAALALAPQSIAAQMRELIGRLLGPTALEDSPAAPDVRTANPGALPGAPAEPSLQAAPKAPKLRLRDSDTSLQLRPPSP